MKLTSEQRRELTNYKSDKPSRTQQQFVEETNVNSIIRKYQKNWYYFSPHSPNSTQCQHIFVRNSLMTLHNW